VASGFVALRRDERVARGRTTRRSSLHYEDNGCLVFWRDGLCPVREYARADDGARFASKRHNILVYK